MLPLRAAFFTLAGSAIVISLPHCTPTPPPAPETTASASATSATSAAAPKTGTQLNAGKAESDYLTITPTPPKDLPSRSASLEELAKFAWQEFLALNWKSSWGKDHKRGTPDLGWDYSMPVPMGYEPVVWHTYAETTELRPNGPLATKWDDLGLPRYSYANAPLPDPSDSSISFQLWNNLDENNEIGFCDVYGQYEKQGSPKNLVLFQAKVNKDEYEYVRTSYGKDQHLGNIQGDPKKPACDGNGPHGSLCAAQLAVKSNITSPPYAYYPGAKDTCSCPPGQAICLPCGGSPVGAGSTDTYEGAIEVKSAWRKLVSEDPSRYYTTNAVYYDVGSDGKVVYKNGVFALIGLHIIHKTTNFPDYVFATWEHVDVESTDMEYVEIVGDDHIEKGPHTPIKRQAGQTDRTQLHPIPPALTGVTSRVHEQLKALNKDTVWQNYRLAGVQGAVVDCPSDLHGTDPTFDACVAGHEPATCAALDPNYFMANFVIESDPSLNNFSGPGFGGAPFKTCDNTVYQGKKNNMGGCKGCHGVAQTAFGTDFSFLLDFGNNKPSLDPDTITRQLPKAGSPKKASRNYRKGIH
jgi:hypothetical protein